MLGQLLKSNILEPTLVFVLAIVIWMIGAEYEAFEMLVDFMEEHESWDLDELFLAVIMLGIAGFFNAYRYHFRQRKEMERRLQAESDLDWLSRHDNLTGLPNRHYLKQFIERTDYGSMEDSNKKYGLISVDLDGFKKANDLLGHAGGDRLLKEVAERITSNKAVKMAFRLGGDEFLAIVSLTQATKFDDIAKQLHADISQPILIDGITNHIGASIGLARYPEDGDTLKDVIHNSDLAMYSAKRSGKNTIAFFETPMLALSIERSRLEQDLLAAMANDEIRPHYQPLIDLKTGKLRGFEALARWNRDGHGFVPPEKFISVAEDIGVITELSDKLLLQACRDAKTWPDDLTLSFNLSPVQLSDRLVGLRVISILGEAEFPPHRLEVEITESSLVQDMDTASFILKALHNAGVRIALDDFGTGYSNLSQLSQLNFDRIKIDRSFINNFETDEKQMRIVKTILSLGEGLGLHTTAEGIEEMEQLSILKDLGCQYGQGYHLGKPVDAEETTRFINNHLGRGESPLRVIR
ncbi:putative bifunctional diguanylate cyclase/phosphodiesterase [Coralliovum pocilloporae]|uniref:putative bifunctional diguanylate cyclase/phosphodiesterase n=1 Tax=Coralliovum pocilloporae TaxID=3066369 RepID=UPI003306D579